jgi:hypothetical protein
VVLVVGVQPATYSVELVETLQLSQLARERERESIKLWLTYKHTDTAHYSDVKVQASFTAPITHLVVTK